MSEERVGSNAPDLRRHACTLLAAYLRTNAVPSVEVPDALRAFYAAFADLASSPAAAVLEPAVPIRKSVTPRHIVCLEDGRKVKILKRHLRMRHGLTPEAYRAKWGLPHRYPMVAPGYTVQRSKIAKESGLGRKAEHRLKTRK